MKVAVAGSRDIVIDNINKYLPPDVDEIITGGAKGVDDCAKRCAKEMGIKYKKFLPEYNKYGRAAPIIRNKRIVEYADVVIAFWDAKSKGTMSTIEIAKKFGKPISVYIVRSKNTN